MNMILPTFIIFLLCVAGLGISLFFRRKPLEKRCSSEPDGVCKCRSENEVGECVKKL